MAAAQRWESCGLTTYPTAPPAACRYPPTPLSPPPCHTCSRPEPPERYPTNTSWSGSTCTDTTLKAAKNGRFAVVKPVSPFFCVCLLAEEEHEEWQSGRRGRVISAYITLTTASCHTWITPGKVGRLLLLTQIHTSSIRQNDVILHLFCYFPSFAALNNGYQRLLNCCHTDLKIQLLWPEALSWFWWIPMQKCWNQI